MLKFCNVRDKIMTARGTPVPTIVICVAGILGSLFSLLQFLSSPLTGALSDVYGRKPLLIATLVSS